MLCVTSPLAGSAGSNDELERWRAPGVCGVDARNLGELQAGQNENLYPGILLFTSKTAPRAGKCGAIPRK